MPRPSDPDRAEAFFARLMDGPLRRPHERAERPDEVGGWVVEAEIGHGGGSRVYAASRPTPTGTLRAAVKLAKRRSPHTLALFETEARVARRLSPPTVARLFEAGRHRDGRPFLALEAVDGACVTDHARPLPPPARLAVAVAMCRAVGRLHAAGLVHADLKPAHLVVRPSGDVTVLDLGLVRGAGLEDDGPGRDGPGRGGLPAITPEFAAPEQVLGGAVGPAADVYALGLIAHEVLTGEAQRVPWVLGGPGAVLDLPASPAETAPGAVWASVDWRAVAALRAAVHPAPERRHATADALARSLRAALDATVGA